MCTMTQLNHSSDAKNQALSKAQQQTLCFSIYILLNMHVCAQMMEVYCMLTTLYWCMQEQTLKELTNHVNIRLRNILDWCSCYKLSLNPLQSEFMVVATNRIETRPQLFIGADKIKEVQSFRYHRIYIDTQLNYNAQIRHLKSKLNKLCGVSFRLSESLKIQAAKNQFNSCIFSLISCCIGVWGGLSHCTSRCNVLNIIHRRIVKNLFSKFFSRQSLYLQRCKNFKN